MVEDPEIEDDNEDNNYARQIAQANCTTTTREYNGRLQLEGVKEGDGCKMWMDELLES
jgi:hypothetical protein